MIDSNSSISEKEQLVLEWSELVRNGLIDKWRFYALMLAFIKINEWQGLDVEVSEAEGILMLIQAENCADHGHAN